MTGSPRSSALVGGTRPDAWSHRASKFGEQGRQKKYESFVLHIRTIMSEASPARRTLQRSASGACGEGISGVPFPRCPHPTLKSTTVTAEGPPGCGTGTWSSVKVWRVSTLEPRALAASLGSPALIPPVAGVINLPRKSCAARRPLGRGPAGRVDHCTTVPPRRPPGSDKHACNTGATFLRFTGVLHHDLRTRFVEPRLC